MTQLTVSGSGTPNSVPNYVILGQMQAKAKADTVKILYCQYIALCSIVLFELSPRLKTLFILQHAFRVSVFGSTLNTLYKNNATRVTHCYHSHHHNAQYTRFLKAWENHRNNNFVCLLCACLYVCVCVCEWLCVCVWAYFCWSAAGKSLQSDRSRQYTAVERNDKEGEQTDSDVFSMRVSIQL